jgi:hypothetical protein
VCTTTTTTTTTTTYLLVCTNLLVLSLSHTHTHTLSLSFSLLGLSLTVILGSCTHIRLHVNPKNPFLSKILISVLHRLFTCFHPSSYTVLKIRKRGGGTTRTTNTVWNKKKEIDIYEGCTGRAGGDKDERSENQSESLRFG